MCRREANDGAPIADPRVAVAPTVSVPFWTPLSDEPDDDLDSLLRKPPSLPNQAQTGLALLEPSAKHATTGSPRNTSRNAPGTGTVTVVIQTFAGSKNPVVTAV